MEKENIDFIASVERFNWWYMARRGLLGRILRSLNRRFLKVLDAGCGTGANYEILSKYSGEVHGIDSSEESVRYASVKGYKSVEKARLEETRGGNYDLIVCMDVLEHIDDDLLAVKTLKSMLAPGGNLILSVPAFKYLWNDNDVYCGHVRRYEMKGVTGLVTGAGLEIIYKSYWNFLLFLPVLMFYNLRKIFKRRRIGNNLSLLPGLLNNLLYLLLKFENILFLKTGFPAGVSIVCVCEKPKG